MKMGKIRKAYRDYVEHGKEEKATYIIYLILRALVIVIMIMQFYNKNYENVFLCILTLFLLVIPNLIEMNFRIEFPSTMEIIIMLMIFSAEILGEINAYYIIFPFWDVMLHTINGFIAAALGFSLVDILNRSEKSAFHLSPFFVAMVSFCFSMTIGITWEFFEFAMDMIFKFDMQKDTVITAISTVMLDENGRNTPVILNNIKYVTVNGQDLNLGGYLDIGLIDTMKDMIVNFIGAIVFSIIGYFYTKNSGHGKIAKLFIITELDAVKDKNKINSKKVKPDISPAQIKSDISPAQIKFEIDCEKEQSPIDSDPE